MKKLIFILFLIGVNVIGMGQSVQLVKPTVGDIWKAFTVQKIQWTSNNIANIKLESSLDSGRTWSLIVGSYPASASYYNWTVPYKPSDSCYIRISDVLIPPSPGEVFNNPFKIPAAGLSIDSLPAFSYAKTVMPITWVSGGIQRINIYVSYDGGVNFKKITDSVNTGNAYYNWIVPDTIANNCFIKIKSAGSDSTEVTSSTSFQIRSLLKGSTEKFKGGAYDGHASANNNTNKLLLTVLNVSDTLSGNTSYTIKWQQNNINLVTLLYSLNNGVNWQTIIANTPASSLNYTWTIPSTPTNAGKIKIVDANDSSLFNICSGYFVIKSKTLKITTPDSSSAAFQNTVLPIGWTSGGVTAIRIQLLSNNIKTVLADSIASGNESFNWVIPKTISDSFRILLTDRSDSTLKDSSAFIKVKILPQPTVMKYRGGGFDGHALSANTQPSIKLTYPAGGELLSVSTNYTIKWTATNLDRIRLDISIDSGKTWSLIADSIPASSPNYAWKSPVKPSVNCLIRARNTSDSTLYSISSAVFTLKPKNIINTTDSLNWTKGTGKSIEWQSGGVDTVKVAYKTSLKNNWVTIKDQVPASFTVLNWTIPTTVGDSVWVKITDITDSTVTDERGYWGNMQKLIQSFSPVKYQGGSFDGHAVSSSTLTKKIIITSPIAFETIAAASTYSITWTPVNITDSVALQFSIDGGINWANIATVLATANSYLWQVPKKYTGGQNGNDTAINSTQCQIRALALPVSGNILVGANDRTFTISSATPIIKSIIPTSGTVGDSIYIRGNRFLGASIVKLNSDTVSSFTVVNDSTIRAIVGTGSTGPVYVKNAVGFNTDTAIKFVFVSLPKPVITSFTPVRGLTGTAIQIFGSGFKKVDSVLFGGLSATSFTVNSDSVITAIIGKGNTGKIGLHNLTGSSLSTNIFTYYDKPLISSFSPASALKGTFIQIIGKGFTGVNVVSFGGVNADSVRVINDTAISARVAQGNTGLVRVFNPLAYDSSKSNFTFLAKPVITSIVPNQGSTGSSIIIKGSNFSGASFVKFGTNSATSFVVTSDTSISAIVGAGATGPMYVTTSSGTNTDTSVRFTYYSKPQINSFTPTSGAQGTFVQISGRGFVGTSAVSFGGVLSDSIKVVNDSLVYARVRNGNTGLIRVSNPVTFDTSKSYFTFVSKPVITSILPIQGTTGSAITIKGANFSGSSIVKFGANAATSFVVTSDSTISAIVGTGTTGPVYITNFAGINADTSVRFTFIPPAQIAAPIIKSFSPLNGSTGTVVQIKGNNFTGINSVLIGGVATSSFSVLSDSVITAVVGNGKTGNIKVQNITGSDSSSTVFTYYAKPQIISFTPTSGVQGTFVQISGRGFMGTSAVSFGGVLSDSIKVVNDSLVYARVANGNTGLIRVSNPVTFDTSKSYFTFVSKPVITSILPIQGTTGSAITIKGANFSGSSVVKFGANAAASFVVTTDSTINAIVGNGATGSVYITNSAGINADTSVRFTFIAPAQIAAPKIKSFSPLNGSTGTVVQIRGNNFTGINSVLIGGVATSSFSVLSDSIMTAVVGNGRTGNIKVQNITGSDSSSTVFTYYTKPQIISFTPTSGVQGIFVQISGRGFMGTSAVSFGGVLSDSIKVVNDSTLVARVGMGSTGMVRVSNSVGYDSTQTLFIYFQKPIIKSFTPEIGFTGTNIQISGTHFTGVSSVFIGGSSPTSFSILSDSLISMVVGNGTTGKIVLSSPAGSDTSSKIFTYYVKPVLGSFTPDSGIKGTWVQLMGKGFTGANAVSFGGVLSDSITVVNDSLVYAKVGQGNTGIVRVYNSFAYDSSKTLFTYIQKPSIKSFTPEIGSTGTNVQISGVYFTGVSSVLVGGSSPTSFSVISDSLISILIGNGASGKIVVKSTAGNDTSLKVFSYYVKPLISSFTPTTGTLGDWIQINGKNFTGINGVSFGGTKADSITVANDSTLVAKVGLGNTGIVRVYNSFAYDSSKTLFTYIQKPSIKSFTPEIGSTGTNVQISGIYFTGVNSVLVGGSSPTSFSVISDSLISILIGNGASGKIIVKNPAGNDTSSKVFSYYVKPLISSFTPTTGTLGDWIQINGKNFTGISGVSFGGTKADSILIVNDSLIRAKVGLDGTGKITVSNLLLSDTSKTIFTYLYKPIVNSFTPTSGATGTLVTISGSHFTETQSVLVGGSNANYTVVNDSTITIIIGTGTTGQITVTNNNGKNTSSGIFTYFKPPVVSSFTPTSGTKGTLVTILGSGFNGVSSVNFGVTPAISFVVNNDSLITAIVGAGSSGLIKVDNNKGTGVSSSPFTYNIIVLTPSITSFSPTSGLVGSLITIIGKNLFLPQQLSIGGVPAVPVSNTGDTIVAMVMPGTITGPVSITTSEGSATSSGNQFTISTSFYPSAQQGFKIVDSTANGLIKQGSSVALSADGNTAVIGGTGDENNRGAAWIYKRNNNVWQKMAKLIPNDNTGSASFAGSVSISADGKTVLLGGETDNKNNGAAWVFVNKGSDTWMQQGVKLNCTGAIGTQLFFGHSVSLSADGNTAVIGGNGDNNNQGAVWVFMRNGSSWIQQGQKLVGSDNTGPAAQGSSVAVSADGNTFIEGGINDNASTGAVWVFSKKNGNWVQQGLKLVANDKSGASKQGTSVAISGDGNTILNGGSTDNSSAGAAWIFTRADSVWAQGGIRLTGKGLLGKTFNESAVALSADGKLAIVGQKGENNNIGSSSLYQKVNGYWKQQGLKLSANDATGMSYQGNSVAISSDGNTVLMGGINDANGLGATWAFVPANIWLGNVSVDWDTPNNWAYASIPQAGDMVVVPKTVNQPVMSSSSEIGKLVLDSAAILTLNGPLKVAGSISNNGSILGTGSLILNGLLPRQIIGKGVIRNLTLYDSTNVSIDADTTSITGSITPNKGVLKSNGNVRLISTSGGSATIGIGSGNYLTGNVIVQRYISNLPDWRMIGFPFVDSSKITASQLKTFFPYGYSAFSYAEPNVTNGNINTGWTPFASGQITSGKGLLINGGEPISTMQLSAPVNTGTINIPLSYTQLNLNNGWNLISNPYPANINWNTIIANNPSGLQNAIYRYDPYSSSYAAYVNGVSTGNLNNIIENGAGFFVRSIGATSLTVREADKTFLGPVKSLAGIDTLQSMTKLKSSVRLSLLAASEKNADEVVVRWGVDPATDNFDDKFDAFDLGRGKFADLSVVGEDKTLYSIFHGSALKSKSKEARTINLRTGNMKPGVYSFNSTLLSPMFDNNELYLVDDYLRKSTLISSDSCNYSFVITSDTLSALNSRFRLTFNYKAPDNTLVTGGDIRLLSNPSSVNQFVLTFGAEFKRVDWNLVDERGIQIKTGTFYDIIKGQTKTSQTGNVSSGLYFIKLIADGQPLTPLKWIKQ